MEDFKPMPGMVFIERHKSESITDSGIYIQRDKRDRVGQATVIAVGEGKRFDNGNVAPVDICVGQTVVAGLFLGEQVKFGDKMYAAISQDDILAIIE